MKKILKLILSIVGLLLTVRIMWYFGIALDEKWTLSEFKSFLGVSEFIILFTFLYLIIIDFIDILKNIEMKSKKNL